MMHCEKKICENILNTISGANNYARARMDMMNIEIRRELSLQINPADPNDSIVPKALYVLRLEERKKMLAIMENLRIPLGYARAIHK